MADTIRSAEETKEYFDAPGPPPPPPDADVLDAKVATLVGWIKDARHFIAFTGAGTWR
jgi:hypothetical protein